MLSAADRAFVPLGEGDLDAILCHEEACVVTRDNTVTIGDGVLQIAPQPGRRSRAGSSVTVRQHLDGRYTITSAKADRSLINTRPLHPTHQDFDNPS